MTLTKDDGTVFGPVYVPDNGTWSITLPDGFGNLTPRFTDVAGNVVTGAPVYYNTYPFTAAVVPDAVKPFAGGVFSGKGQPGSTIVIKDPKGAPIGTTTVNPDATWTLAKAGPLPAGTTTYDVANTISNGAVTHTPTKLTLPTRKPPTPTAKPSDGTIVNGAGELGDTATLTDATGTVLGTVPVAADGSITIPLSPAQPDGAKLSLRVTDPAGNVSDPAQVTVDSSRPSAPAVKPTDGRLAVGTAEPGTSVTVKDPDGKVLGTGPVGADGTFSIPLSPRPSDGTRLTVTATDATGNVSDPTLVTVDSSKPAAPKPNPTIGKTVTGKAEPDTTVTVKDKNGVTLASGPVGPDGTFSIPLNPAQPDGTPLTLTATDKAGNVSDPASVTVDASAPAAPIVNPSDGTAVSGTAEPGATVTVNDPAGNPIGTGTAGDDGKFSIPLNPTQPDGATLTVTATDSAGNVSAPTPVTVDSSKPEAPKPNPTNGKTATGTAEPGTTVTVKDPNGKSIGSVPVAPDGTFSIPLSPVQPDGAVLTLVATDPSGNTSGPATVTVDDSRPDAPKPDPTNGKTVTGTAESGTAVTVKDPSGAPIGTGTVAPDGTFSIPLTTPQPDRAVLSLTATDPSGNVSDPASVIVDASKPNAPKPNPTGGKTVTGTAEPGTTVTVKDPSGIPIGTGKTGDDGTFSIPLTTPQPDGAVLSLAATDPAGNVSDPASVTVDASKPNAPKPKPTNGTSATGTAEPGTIVTVKGPDGKTLGTGAVAPDGTFSIPLSPKPSDGDELTLTATDPSGNVSDPATVTVDSVKPDAPILNPTNGTNVTGTAEPGATVTVKDPSGTPVGTGIAGPDGTFTIPLSPAQPDKTPLTVTATDPSGNESDPTPVTVDASKPDAPKPNPTDGKTVTGTAEPGTTITVKDPSGNTIGTGTVGDDGKFSIPLTVQQPDGTPLTVTATDNAGNVSNPATVTVDGLKPDAPKPNPTDGKTATGTAEPGTTVTVRDPDGKPIGSGVVAPNGTFSIPLTTSQPNGAVLSLTATDPAGNVSDPASVTVDASRPDAPKHNPTNGKIVTGVAEPGTTVTVKDPDGKPIGSGVVAPDGTFSIPLTAGQPDKAKLTLTATDPAGNESAPASVTVDASKPAAPILNPTDGKTVTGTAEPGTTVTVHDPNGNPIGTGTAGPDGTFSIPLTTPQPDGTPLTVTATDPAGNISDPATVIVDASKPAAPKPNPTNGKTVSGTAEAGTSVTVKDPDGKLIGSGTVAPDGTFSIPLTTPQPDGAVISLTATDPAGNVSDPATVTVDASKPDAPKPNPTSGKTVTGAAEKGTTVTITDPAGSVIGTGKTGDDGTFSIPLSPAQPDGAVLTLVAKDPSGNTSDPASVTVDDSRPDAPKPNPTNGKTVAGTAEPGTTVTVKDPSGAPIGTGTVAPDGTFSIPLTTPQPDSAELSLTATDPSGNVSDPASVTVDASKPNAPKPNPTDGKTVTGTAEPGTTVTVKDPDGKPVGAGPVAPDGTFSVPLSAPQPDKTVLTLTATDPAGNVSDPASATVDASKPAAPILNPTDGKTVTGTAEPGTTVTVRGPDGKPIGTGVAGPDGKFSIPLTTPQPDGTPLTVTATDPSGNESDPTPVTVDASKPDAPQPNPTNGKTVTGTAEPGTTVTVTDPSGAPIGTGKTGDDGTFSIPLSPAQPDKAPLSLTATDPAGNVSEPATVTVDASKPDVPVLNPSDGKSVTGNAEPGTTVTVKDPDGKPVGTGTVAPDGTFSIPLTEPQPDGAPLTVTATDAAGNVSDPATVIVDASKPDAPKPNPTNGKTVTGTAEPGTTVTVRDPDGKPIGSGTVAPDGTFSIPLTVAQPDKAPLSLTSTDSAGNVSDPATLVVDASKPDAPKPNPSGGKTVTGMAEPGTTVTILDPSGKPIGTGPVATDGTFSIPLTTSQPDGAKLSLVATDSAGNVSDPATVTVDAVKPDAPILNPTDGKTVTGTAEPGSTVTVRDPDGKPIGTGTAGPDGTFSIPLTTPQPDGTPLTVTATDPSGNVSDPAKVTVDAAKPDAPILNPSDGKTVTGTAEPGSTVTVRDPDGKPIGSGVVAPDGTFSIPLSTPQPDGTPLTVTATDAAGNVSDPTTVVVDASKPDAPKPNPTNGSLLTGTAEPGSAITVRGPDGTVLGTGTAATDGTFAVVLSPKPGVGDTVAVTATDAAGNQSDPAQATVDALGIIVRVPTLHRGDVEVAIGLGFNPGEQVTGTMRSAPFPLGTQKADRDGTVTFTWKIPAGADLGAHQVELTGAESGSVSGPFSVIAEPVAAGHGAGTGPGLAHTGSDVLPFIYGAVALGLVGVFLLLAAARRRRREEDTQEN
ncbi:Ig-like domain-containing protein [Leifsonia poae]|uniref:Ig-like domain-containing protein n=1 Tax=Leifsonia poae TaxID=110933 RepID=UPI003D67C19A